VDQVVLSFLSGLAAAGIYAILSVGLVLLFRATGTLNFAHGEFLVLGAMLVGSMQASHYIPVLPGILVAGVIVAAVAVIFYQIVLRRLIGSAVFMPVIATLGLAAILDGVLSFLYTSNQYSVVLPGITTRPVDILGAHVGVDVLAVSGIAFAITGVVVVIFRFTTLGTRVRAAGQDPMLASQGGINVRWIYLASWAAAGFLATIAGVLLATTEAVNTSTVDIGLAAFPAVLLGGLDSVEGALVGSLVIGMLEGFTTTYLGTNYLELVDYLMLLVVVLFLPAGLFGTREVRRL
jgi:branched-chain amino acid transport system permease protein